MREILAPAGDEASAYAAINSGADAIYLGLAAFSARSSAANFGFPALEKLINHAHIFGVKIYVAMNTLVKEEELSDFVQNAVNVWNTGADAIIIQDMFLGSYLKKTYPQMVLHLSTQAGVNNAYGAAVAKKLGFDRVILARETPLADVKEITKIIETEVFVQGALCTCFSGQCYLSSFAGGNSGNRGKCKQPCRKTYSIDRKGFEERAYRLSLSDLSVGEDIEKLIDAGVSSFKIEGRMRRPEYVAAAVTYYKNLLGGTATPADKSALKRTFNRGNYTKGLAFGQDKSFISSAVQGHIGEYLGQIKVVGGKFICQTNAKCSLGDGFKILRQGKEVCGATYGGEAKGGFYLNSGKRLINADKVFITTDCRLNEKLLTKQRKLNVNISARFALNERAQVTVNGKQFLSDFIAQPAATRPLTQEDVKKCFDKTDIYPFEVTYSDIEIVGDIFLPASSLNAFRREVYLSFAQGFGYLRKKLIVQPLPTPVQNTEISTKTAVIATDLNGLSAEVGILKPNDYNADLKKLCLSFKGEKYLYLPPFMTGEEIEAVKPKLTDFDGIYGEGYYSVALAEELNKKLFAGTGFNLSNSVALSQLSAEYICLSKELTKKEAKQLASQNTFYLTCGDIKVMDLIYCPFEKSCKVCDILDKYTLTDDNGRQFPLRRYKVSACRFELYNCASLISENTFTGKLIDCTLQPDPQEVIKASCSAEKLKNIFKNYTKGHTEIPVN